MEYIIGDCLEKLDDVKDDSIAMIYLDPPFDSGRDYTMSHENSTGFSDTWKGDEYRKFIVEVVDKCIPKLKKDGSFYFHISAEKMFTPEQILREKFKHVQPIFWRKCRSKNNVKHKLGATIDIIFRCSKMKNPKFNIVYQSRDEAYVKNSFNNKDDRGNYSLGHLVTENTKKGYMYTFEFGDRVYNPPSGWRIKQEELEKLKVEDRLHTPKTKNSKLYKKIYLHETEGKPCTDLWDDIHSISQGAELRTYPTAKPIKLLERIISISTDEGDTVLDPMCGSGTTGKAAKNLKRSCILIDKNDNTDIINMRTRS
jgi:site-specific DNA-methyltransferase (adenine-specific)